MPYHIFHVAPHGFWNTAQFFLAAPSFTRSSGSKSCISVVPGLGGQTRVMVASSCCHLPTCSAHTFYLRISDFVFFCYRSLVSVRRRRFSLACCVLLFLLEPRLCSGVLVSAPYRLPCLAPRLLPCGARHRFPLCPCVACRHAGGDITIIFWHTLLGSLALLPFVSFVFPSYVPRHRKHNLVLCLQTSVSASQFCLSVPHCLCVWQPCRERELACIFCSGSRQFLWSGFMLFPSCLLLDSFAPSHPPFFRA